MAIQASIIGNLAADCEQVTLGQTPALKFRVGSTRSRKDKDGNRVTDWVTVVYFRTQLQQYLVKGTKVAVFGELEASPWTSQQGQLNAGLQVVANNIEFLSKSETQQTQYQQAPQMPQQPQYAPPQSPVPPQFPPQDSQSGLPF